MNSFKEREETRTSLDQKTQPLRESRLHPNFKKLASFGTQGMLGLTALYCGGEYFNEQNVTAGLIAGSILVYGIYRFTESMCPPVEEPSKHPFDDDDLLNF